jgi:hypothetical protein
VSCVRLLLEAARPPRPADGPEAPAKPDGVSRADLQRWLREFAGLDDAPGQEEWPDY